MRRKLLILACLMSMNLAAKNDYPNTLIVELSNGSSVECLLEGTVMQLLPSTNQLKITTTENNQELTLSDIKKIKYEYHDPNTLGIGVISKNSMSSVEVYDLEGRRLSIKNNILKSAMNEYPKGVYIMKVNGQTYKIAK